MILNRWLRFKIAFFRKMPKRLRKWFMLRHGIVAFYGKIPIIPFKCPNSATVSSLMFDLMRDYGWSYEDMGKLTPELFERWGEIGKNAGKSGRELRKVMAKMAQGGYTFSEDATVKIGDQEIKVENFCVTLDPREYWGPFGGALLNALNREANETIPLMNEIRKKIRMHQPEKMYGESDIEALWKAHHFLPQLEKEMASGTLKKCGDCVHFISDIACGIDANIVPDEVGVCSHWSDDWEGKYPCIRKLDGKLFLIKGAELTEVIGSPTEFLKNRYLRPPDDGLDEDYEIEYVKETIKNLEKREL